MQVSNEGSSFYYLSKNEPPLINLPVCGAKVSVRQPQQVIFSWLPRNTSSPASAGGTRYEFSLYEIRPEGRNPNDVVLSSQPVFKTTIDYTQLVYGPAEPQLIENMRYAWRVRAIDTQGRDAFRNNGYSEVCTFTYGGVDPAFIVGGIEGLQAEGESERSARIWWEQGNFDSYRIYYKKSGQGHEWFTSDLLAHDLDPAKEEGELKLFDLEPDTEYETRAQAKKMGSPGPYTEIIKFRTLPIRVAHCGDPALLPEGGPGEPFREAIKGMTIDVDGMEMTLLDVVHLGDGWYKGLGRISVDYLGGAAFTVSFDRIFINTDRQVVLGRIDFVTKGTAAMADEQLAAQEKRKGEREAESLAVNGNGNEGKDIIFEGVIDSVYVNEKGEIIIIDTEGERFVYGQPVDPATGVVLPVNIVDGGGNGYVVDNGGKMGQEDLGGVDLALDNQEEETEEQGSKPKETRFIAHNDKGYGFDNTKEGEVWQSIELARNDKVTYNIKPDSTFNNVYFHADPSHMLSVSSYKAESSSQELTLTSKGMEGTSEVIVSVDSTKGEVINNLKVQVYSKKRKNLRVIILHEENDDVQEVAVGYRVAPHTVCVSAGANGFLDTRPNWVGGEPDLEGDDEIDEKGNITVGANGICETEALSRSLKTRSIDVSKLRNVLNNVIYNQAVFEWNVVDVQEISINWDLNKNQVFEIFDYNTSFQLVMGSEFKALDDELNGARGLFTRDQDSHFIIISDHSEPIVLNNRLSDPYGYHLGEPYGQYTFVFGHKSPDIYLTIAHELGHSAFGFKDNTYKVRQPLNLMNHVQLEDYINRILLLKEQWDVIQHTE